MRIGTAFVSSFILLLAGLDLLAQGEQDPPAPAGSEDPAEEESAVSEGGGLVTAYTVRRAITVSGPPIRDAVILVQDGVIKAVGPRQDVTIPSGAKVVDMPDGVALPGFVHPAALPQGGAPSSARDRRPRYNTAGTASDATKKVTDKLDLQRDELRRWLEAGYTTVAVIPTGGGLVGLGCLIRPVPSKEEGILDLEELLIEDAALLSMGFSAGTASKEAFDNALTKSREYLTQLEAYEKAKKAEAEKKPEGEKKEEKKEATPKEPAKEGEGKPAEPEKGKDEEKKGADAKEDPKAKDEAKKPPTEPKPDAKLLPMIEVLQGKQVGLLALAGAAEFLHAAALFEKEKGFRPTLIMVPQGFRSPMDAWRVVDQLKGLKVPVILAPQIDRVPRTATRRLTQNVLIDAGVPVALVPDPSSGDEGLESLAFLLADLVRHGCREDQVLRAVTLTPAEILGIQGRCGSLEVGKDADILLFSGDPLVPTSALERVIIDGRTVYQRSEKKP